MYVAPGLAIGLLVVLALAGYVLAVGGWRRRRDDAPILGDGHDHTGAHHPRAHDHHGAHDQTGAYDDGAD